MAGQEEEIAEQLEEGGNEEFPRANEATRLRRSSNNSSSSSGQTSSEDDRSRASSPASTESPDVDELIGCIPEESEDGEDIQDGVDKLRSRDTPKGQQREAGSHAAASRSDMDLLKAILLDGPPPSEDAIPEESEHDHLDDRGQSLIRRNKESHHESQVKDEIQRENQHDNRNENADESRHENADESHHENVDESHHENVDESHHENADESRHENADGSRHENADKSRHENADESRHENTDESRHENADESRHENADESHHENADESHHENADESHHENADKSRHENADESRHENADESRHENSDESHHKNADESHHKNADESRHKNADESHHKNADESRHENVDESHHENLDESHHKNADESRHENVDESRHENADESHHENADESHHENADESHEEGNESRSNAKPPKKSQQKKKKKKLRQQLPNPEPWSRAAIKSFSRRVPRADALPSDRSASIATGAAGSVGAGSRGSRALSAKELRTKFRPVSNEEKLNQRLHELDSLLAIDYAKEARMAYQRSVAECQQSWQNYVSTTRIMGDVPRQDQRQRQHSYPPHPAGDHSTAAAAEATATGVTNEGRQSHYPLGPRIAPALTSSSASLRNQENHHKDNNNNNNKSEKIHDNNEDGRDHMQQLHGYRVGAPEPSGGRFGSDHRLSESSNPDVRAWLKEKNRSARRQRKETREAKRREMQDRLDAMQKRSDRKLEAAASFQDWVRQKQRQLQLESDKAGRANGSRVSAAKTDQQPESLPLADQESIFAELEQHRPSPPGPKPVHNSVFKRSSSSLGTAGASFSGRQVRMGVVGRRVPESPAPSASALLAIEQQPGDEATSAAPPRLSFAEWSNRKAVQMSTERRRQQELKAAEVAAAASSDPQMAALVPKLARQRIRVAAELKSHRTDTGLGLSRPKTAVPALCAPVMPVAVRQRPTTGRVRSSLMERREAEITSDLPNPFVTPADDVILDGIIGIAGSARL